MKKSPLQIYTDRLKNEETERIFENVAPEFLQTPEKELSFEDDVAISGKAYLAENHLILDLKIKATAKMPCSICNKSSIVHISIDDFTFTIEITEVPSGVFDYTEEIRSAILIRIPQFFECQGGKCPQRKDINKYLKPSSNETYTPFSALDT